MRIIIEIDERTAPAREITVLPPEGVAMATPPTATVAVNNAGAAAPLAEQLTEPMSGAAPAAAPMASPAAAASAGAAPEVATPDALIEE